MKNNETPLLDLLKPEVEKKRAPASRRSDPYTSHVSEIELDVSGKRAAACALALSLVLATPGLTANEYEHKAGVPDGHLRKRLNDLWKEKQIRKGRVRRSAVTGKLNQTWWPSGEVAKLRVFYGDTFMSHDDFYDEEGNAIQPARER